MRLPQIHSFPASRLSLPCRVTSRLPQSLLSSDVLGYAGFQTDSPGPVVHRLVALNATTLIVDLDSGSGLVTGPRGDSIVHPRAGWRRGVCVALTPAGAMFAPVREGLDILVNNAGVTPVVPVAEMSAEQFDRVFTVNAKFPLLAMRQAATVLRDQGRIINISTLNTALPAPGLALYCASKAALEQFTAVAAREFGARGITVNTVSPGATDTDLLRGSNSPEVLDQMVALTALGRLGEPDDIAGVVAFLAGPDAQWITGQNIRATGGMLI